MPAVVEVKRTLAGDEKRFNCRLLSGNAGHVVLLWVAPDVMNVHGVVLPAGTVTFGHYWGDRPYNVYHWMDTVGQTLGYYFNIADQTRIAPDRLSWRDLVVDVLVLPGAPPRVLDEDELPANLPAELRATIDAGVAAVVGGGENLIDEIAAASRRLAPRVFPDAA